MATLFNRVGMTTTTVGSSTVTLGSAISASVPPFLCSYLTAVNSGVTTGTSIVYLILDNDGSWELGATTYSTGTFVRGATISSTGPTVVSTSPISLSGNAQVFLTARKEDLVTGPASATDNAAVRYDGTSGKPIQDSALIIDDSGNISSFGGNITFPAVQSASAGANTLDDYEEGTWTPSIGGTATYTTQIGIYRKIGSVVCIWCSMTINVIGTGSTTTVSGLPFTIGSPGSGAPVSYFASLLSNVVYICGNLPNGATTIVFETLAAAAATITDTTAIFQNGTTVVFSAVYRV